MIPLYSQGVSIVEPCKNIKVIKYYAKVLKGKDVQTGLTDHDASGIPGGVAHPDLRLPKVLSYCIHINTATCSYPLMCCVPIISKPLNKQPCVMCHMCLLAEVQQSSTCWSSVQHMLCIGSRQPVII